MSLELAICGGAVLSWAVAAATRGRVQAGVTWVALVLVGTLIGLLLIDGGR